MWVVARLMFYPVLSRVAETSVEKGLALWYVGTRITESGAYLVAMLATWAFLPLSRDSQQLERPTLRTSRPVAPFCSRRRISP